MLCLCVCVLLEPMVFEWLKDRLMHGDHVLHQT